MKSTVVIINNKKFIKQKDINPQFKINIPFDVILLVPKREVKKNRR